jgi:hypothetical protein
LSLLVVSCAAVVQIWSKQPTFLNSQSAVNLKEL